MVTIPKGTFTMGSGALEPCRWGNEDVHQVTLTHDVNVMATEVTHGLFQSRMGYNPSSFILCGNACPAETLSWHEAVAYCNRLSQEQSLTPCYSCEGNGGSVVCQIVSAYAGKNIYSCPGYRLPTDAEFEYAYRAGTQTAYFNGPNDATSCTCQGDAHSMDLGWYCGNSTVAYGNCYDISPQGGAKCAGTHPVGTKAPNAWGLYDMGGNVWEWGHDEYQDFLGFFAVTDPVTVASGTHRMLRGGGFTNEAHYLRAANRKGLPPLTKNIDTGFRCVRSIGP
jgi:formylglycine-generating enzyme required for sulfatase activity